MIYIAMSLALLWILSYLSFSSWLKSRTASHVTPAELIELRSRLQAAEQAIASMNGQLSMSGQGLTAQEQMAIQQDTARATELLRRRMAEREAKQ